MPGITSRPAPVVTPKVSTPKSTPKVSTPKSSSSSKSTSSKTTTKTKTAKLQKTDTPKTTTVNNYHQSSSAMDWLPFVFLWDMMDEDDTETVIIEDGKVIEQPEQDINGWSIATSILSITLVVAVLALIVRKMFK